MFTMHAVLTYELRTTNHELCPAVSIKAWQMGTIPTDLEKDFCRNASVFLIVCNVPCVQCVQPYEVKAF